MLHLYNKDEAMKNNRLAVVRDVEEAFMGIHLVDDDVTRKVLNAIDNAKYSSEDTVIDRYGIRIYASQLSTGCKAALCVHYLKDKIIDLVECGYNARDAVILNCKEGNAIFYYRDLNVSWGLSEDVPISVSYENKEFYNTREFNAYIDEEEFDAIRGAEQ